MKKLSILLSMIALVLLISCEAVKNTQPIPKDKESFVGLWRTRSGYKFNVKAEGTATITQLTDSMEPDFDSLNIKVAPRVIEDIRVEFIGDTSLMVKKPLVYAKIFRIDHPPHSEGDTTRLILNGVMFRWER